jgi:vacuolar-type H+-ATPase subunit I/STV1
MDGIILNIIAYFLMTIGSYFAFDFSMKNGNKVTQIVNYLILMWNVFMVMYLIIDYKNILQQPLNERLNFFETITNFLLAIWLISFKYVKK